MKFLFFVYLLLFIAVNLITSSNFDNDENWIDLNVIFVDSAKEFEELHPGTHIEYLNTHVNAPGYIAYSLGRRVAGDRIVGTESDNYTWTSPQDVGLTISYPSSGAGSILTYISINVTQTTNLGQAYVTKGGLGQRFISVVVEAYKTVVFNYVAQFYGSN